MDAFYANVTCEWNAGFAKQFFELLSPGVCSGHGDCVNGVCQCYPGYSGSSDIVNFDGFACHNYEWAEKALYLVSLLGYFYVFILSVIAFRAKLRTYRMQVLHQLASGTPYRERLKPWQYLPFRVLIPLAFVSYPCLLATSALKVFTSMRIGVDWIVTATFTVGACVGFCATSLSQYRQFEALARGKLLRSNGGREVARRFKLASLISSLLYCASKTLTVGSIVLQEQGPFNQRAHILLVAINLSVLLYLLVFGTSAQIVCNRVQDLVSDLPSALSISALNEVLGFMQKLVRSTRTASFFIAVVYIFFSTPYLFMFQSYSLGLALLFGLAPNISQGRLMAFGNKSSNANRTTTTFDSGDDMITNMDMVPKEPVHTAHDLGDLHLSAPEMELGHGNNKRRISL